MSAAVTVGCDGKSVEYQFLYADGSGDRLDAMADELVRRTVDIISSTTPVAYWVREHVIEGGLLSYSSDLAVLFRYSAKVAHRILLGARPADCRSSNRPSSSRPLT